MTDEIATPAEMAVLKAILDQYSRKHGIQWGSPAHDQAARTLWSLFADEGINSRDELIAAMEDRSPLAS